MKAKIKDSQKQIRAEIKTGIEEMKATERASQKR
jgi:hypothetical protein